MRDKKNLFIAVSAIWYERFLECSRTQGTDEFSSSVWRFYHSLLNLGENDLAIKNIVVKYTDNIWRPKLEQRFGEEVEKITSSTRGVKHFIRGFVEKELIVQLFEFMIQTIQDSGIGWPTQDEMQGFHIKQE